MDAFTPFSALAGGALIGASAALLLILNGRVAGISGVLGGLMAPRAGDVGWRIAFLAGLTLAPACHVALGGTLPQVTLAAPPALVAAGLLVGIGARLGGGCTSGHGVCGVGRLSPRSLAATAVFMTTAILTVAAMRLMGT